MPRPSDRERRAPDIEIGARVKADRLRFRNKPQVDVRFPGRSEKRTAFGSERKNLPDEVEPGVTYRDVEVDWMAVAEIVDEGDPERSEDEE